MQYLIKKNKFYISICALFLVWSIIYIYKSSFIGIDGKRYFMLFDDAMISMRFAWNFAHGNGLVWNTGEYTQGYTNLLMTLIMTASSLVLNKQYAVLLIQILGIPTVLGVAFLIVKIARELDVNIFEVKIIYKLIFTSVILYYPIVYWSLMGMETGLLSVLLLISILYSLKYIKKNQTNFLIYIAIFMGLAFLTRNESVIFSAIIFTYILSNLLIKKIFIKRLPQILLSTFIYFFIIFGQLIFQYLYYGEWLPNTYTLKLTGMSIPDRITNGLGFIYPFILYTSPLLIFSFIYLIREFNVNLLYILLFPISSIFYQIYVGGDPWLYWRIMAPTMPLLILVFVFSIDGILPATKSGTFQILSVQFNRSVWIVSLTLSGVLLFADKSENSAFLREMTLIWKPYQSDIAADNVNMALILDKITTPDATIGVYWAGSMPYYLDRRTIDFFGKSDRYIANLKPDMSGSRGWNGMTSVPGHNKYNLEYSLVELAPTFTPGFSMGQQDFSDWGRLHYEKVKVEWYSFHLRKSAKEVKWELIKN